MIVLPLPPSVKHAYRYGRNGVYLTAEARRYKTDVAWTVKAALLEALADGSRSGIVRAAEAERISLRVLLALPNRRKRDIDNALSLLLDGIATGLDTDDSRIVELHVVKKVDGERSGCWIWLDESFSEG